MRVRAGPEPADDVPMIRPKAEGSASLVASRLPYRPAPPSVSSIVCRCAFSWLKALAAVPEERRSTAVRETIDACSEFLLQHHVYRRSHDLARVAKPGLTRFGFPRMYQTDTLEIARLLVDLGDTDPRLQDALDLVSKRHQPDGRWLLQDTFNGKFLVDVEQQGAPSKWITLDALHVLQGSERGA